MGLGGTALKLFQTFLYALCFCCSGIILGIYSYFLSVQADRDRAIPRWQKAVEGMSGIGVVYTIFAIILTCCLGGKAFFAFLAIILDILLCGAFIAIAVLTRDGTRSCTGNNVRSPLGTGPENSRDAFGQNGFGSGNGENVTYAASYGFSCRLNKACFAVAIIGAFLFLLSAIVQVWLGRHHKREKRFGPSPKNNYTSGSGKRRFGFGRKKNATVPTTTGGTYAKDAEATGGLAAAGHGVDTYRPSHETGYTGTTAGVNDGIPTNNGTYTGNKYETHAAPHIDPAIPTTGGFHTGPTGTGVNPYGYEQPPARTAGTNF